MAALMVIIINFIVPANNTQKTLEIVLTPVMTSKKQVIATTYSNCWQVPCTLATGVEVLWRTMAGRSSPAMIVKKQVIATTDSNCWQVVTTLATGYFTEEKCVRPRILKINTITMIIFYILMRCVFLLRSRSLARVSRPSSVFCACVNKTTKEFEGGKVSPQSYITPLKKNV